MKIILFNLILAKIDKQRLFNRYISGTTEQRCTSFSLNFNYISSSFHILGRNAQYLCNGERIVQRRTLLPSR